jgi:hypothetical protein
MATPPEGAPRSEPPPRAQLASPLDDVNDAFHDSYGQARDRAQLDGPVFVLLSDTLIVFQRGERRALSFTPRAFHVIKSVSHAPIAIHTALHRLADGARALDTGPLRALHHKLRDSLVSLGSEELTAELLDELRAVLLGSLSYLEAICARGRVEQRELDDFARAMGPRLLRLIDAATHLQLSALDAHVVEAIARMDAAERSALQVVVTGDHQARKRSLPMQYFQTRLREPEGSEERVTYAEGVIDEQQALALVGTRRLDRALAKAFFGDPKRLQRDLLGDSAQRLLGAADLPALL